MPHGASSGLTRRALEGLPPFVYVGRVNCVTGYGAAARHQIHVLRQHGMRFQIVDAGSTADPDPEKQSAFVQACKRSDDLSGSVPVGTIVHLSPNCAYEYLTYGPAPHILVSVWETTRLPRPWVPMVNAFDQVWCATEWQRQVYADSGVEESKLQVVPFALDPTLYTPEGPTLPELQELRADGYTVFGSMFQWSERKAPRVLIGAYLQAFQEGERVALAIKTYEGDQPDDERVRQLIAETVELYRLNGPMPVIVPIARRLTHDETLAFYRGLDVYVQPHRGEGFGLPIAEALLMNRPTLATDWSAPVEYGHGLYVPIDYELEAPHSMNWQPFYTADQLWAVPSIADTTKLLQNVCTARQAGPPWYTETHAPCVAATARFSKLCERAGSAAAKALEELYG